jgi:hypothetical protein
MTLERGRRINFPQNAQGLIAPDQVRAICASPMAEAKPAFLVRSRSYHRHPGSCVDWNKQQNGVGAGQYRPRRSG